jgi:molybdopterin-guanine dinucleotide biosynthesis protein A
MAPTPDISLPPLYGLVLLGGLSRRMGRDKAEQSYHGKPQGVWAYEALQAVCDQVFLSARPNQSYAWLQAQRVIRDSYHNIGPAAGLLSAADRLPEAAWLLLACDMPLVNRTVLCDLVAGRADDYATVAYRHADGTPEPLCAIYEPTACQLLKGKVEKGQGPSLRALLLSVGTRWLKPCDGDRLGNANDPAGRAELAAQIAQRYNE